ncbi:hypothetical protein OK351_06345 [Glutamicibacter sp. MNS18]|uniref:hypothetical protein n=1 Tax=Glutamicibacter sp. MNS18 TaxID=2989817 RepID=UPI00223554A6|nr:hypothetical protein [Glutamicibacter sp. MNS18]MCW4465121.1 hypothetical protein [Glutamicibacter sp. MNS18]
MQIRVRAIDLVDIFAFLVVLGAFVQLLPGVISESFLLSFLTALLLKVVLELVMLVKKPVLARLKVARSPAGRIIASLCLMVVRAGS